jgi:Flp pilus assembly protein TadG
MRLRTLSTGRRGTILPLVAMSIVVLCGFIALAVDVGMMMTARTQCQNAADAAALAGCRTLDGTSTGNVSGATTQAQNAAAANVILGQAVLASDVTVAAGAYHYDATSQTFSPAYPPVAPDNYNLLQATVRHQSKTAFAAVWNVFNFTVAASGTAGHRPRDVAIVLDYSGSMNNESDLWNCETYLGSQINTSNNTDTTFPQFGWYNTTFSPLAAIQCTSTDPRVGKCNVTQSVLGVPAMVTNYYQNARGATTGTAAFVTAPAAVTNTKPGGDKPLTTSGNTTTTPAMTVADVMGNSTTPFSGYKTYNGKFYGYTQGPGYWGMTFFCWPPDPTVNNTAGDPFNGVSNDWRKRFFFLSDGTTPCNDNTDLFNSSGVLNDPQGNYVINYKNILLWIKTNCIQSVSNPNAPFPPVLRAGNVLYYDSVPTDVPASAYTHTNLNNQITDTNTRFWKEYIDYTLGVWRDPFSKVQHPANPACSYGGDFSAGGPGISISGPDANTGSGYPGDPKGNPFINSTDNPKRPRHRFWFGPMTMIQYMSDTGLFPGSAQDISMVAAKLGIQGALTDIQTNHPNDLVSMILFSRPHYQGEPTEVGAFSQAQYSLSRDYASMMNSLWFPPNSSTTDVRPWDSNGSQTPRAHGDYTGNTATSYGFMLAYNQFSSNSTLRSSAVGGFGRVGSQRLVVLETDGMANVASSASFTQSVNTTTGVNSSYYNLGPTDTVTVNGSVTPAQDAENVATKLCALTTDTTNGPGFATPSKPVILHCIAFGAIFEPTAAGSEASNALALMQSLSAIGGTGFPSTVTDTTDPNYYKLCLGTLSDRQTKLRTAFSKIMNQEVAIILVQ